jgi:hypothetical protein
MPRASKPFERQITGFAATWPGDFPALGKALPFSSRVQNPQHETNESTPNLEGTVIAPRAWIIGQRPKGGPYEKVYKNISAHRFVGAILLGIALCFGIGS